MDDKTRIFGMGLENIEDIVRAAEKRARKPLIDKIEMLIKLMRGHEKSADGFARRCAKLEAKLAKADALAEVAKQAEDVLRIWPKWWQLKEELKDALAAYREE